MILVYVCKSSDSIFSWQKSVGAKKTPRRFDPHPALCFAHISLASEATGLNLTDGETGKFVGFVVVGLPFAPFAPVISFEHAYKLLLKCLSMSLEIERGSLKLRVGRRMIAFWL